MIHERWWKNNSLYNNHIITFTVIQIISLYYLADSFVVRSTEEDRSLVIDVSHCYDHLRVHLEKKCAHHSSYFFLKIENCGSSDLYIIQLYYEVLTPDKLFLNSG